MLHTVYHGAPIIPPQQDPATVPPFEVGNYPTTPQQAAAITADIAAEVAAGILIEVTRKPAHITALATKEEAAGKIRVLRDCSKPDKGAINDYADAQHFQMQGIEEALAHMQPRAYMAKVDIKAAFRTVGVHPTHWHLLGFQWKNPQEDGGSPRYYIDTRCPFGLKCSPEIFCRITAAIKVMLAAQGVRAVVVYVDDFLIIALEEDECARALELVLKILRAHLGFTISDPKTVPPTQQLTFVGFVLATNVGGTGEMRITIPEGKLRKAEDMAAQLHGRRTAGIKEIERAVGFFAHIAYARHILGPLLPQAPHIRDHSRQGGRRNPGPHHRGHAPGPELLDQFGQGGQRHRRCPGQAHPPPRIPGHGRLGLGDGGIL